MMSGTRRTRRYAGVEVCCFGSRDLCSHARRELPDRPKVWQRIGLSTLIRSTRAFTRPGREDRMTRHRIRSVGMLVVGASLLLSGACSGHSATSPTTTPPASTAKQVTSVPVSAPSTVPSTSIPPTTTPASTTSGPTRPSPTTPKSTTASPTTVAPAQRFTWHVDSGVPKTKDVQTAIAAAAPAYEGFMATYDESLRAPSSQDWETVMKKYAAGTALSIWRSAWQSRVQYGGHRTGTSSATARVTAAGASEVNMRVCMDFSGIGEVDKAGKPVPGQKGSPTKNFAWLLTISSGKVVTLLGQTPSGKTFSC